MKTAVKYALLIVLFSVTLSEVSAQSYPERRHIRQGNKDYRQGRYIESETDYRKALEMNPQSPEAMFNLANSLYKQERYEEAMAIYTELAKNPELSEMAKDNLYNIGNSLFKLNKLQESLEAYKGALRIDPSDRQAKYNYAYVKSLMDDNEDQDNQDQNDDQNDGGGDGNNQDNDNQNNNEDQSGDGNNDENKPDNNSEQNDNRNGQGNNMSREEAERLLEAMQMNEDKTREKVDARKAKAVGRSQKNW